MRSLATVLLLAATASALQVKKENSKIFKLVNSLSRAQQTNTGQSCQEAIKRFWKPRQYDYNNVIGSGRDFSDFEFTLTRDGMYWP